MSTIFRTLAFRLWSSPENFLNRKPRNFHECQKKKIGFISSFTSVSLSSSSSSLVSFLSNSSWSFTCQFSIPIGILFSFWIVIRSMSTVGLGLGNSLMFSWYTGVRYILFDRFSNASSVAGFNFCKRKYYYRLAIPQRKISSGPERFFKFMTDLYQFVLFCNLYLLFSILEYYTWAVIFDSPTKC